MDRIDVDSVKILNETPKDFDFTDGHNTYKFNRAKSTLFESFPLDEPLYEFGVTYIDNPEDAYCRSLIC